MCNYNILDLLPQRPPIVMVDRFLGIDNQEISKTQLEIREDNIFINEGYISDSGIIEHQAQSAAALMGYICKKDNIPVVLGFIGAVKDFRMYKHIKVGQTLTTKVKIDYQLAAISIISIQSFIDEELVAESCMKIFLQK